MLLLSLLHYSFHISMLDKPDPPAGVPAASDVRLSSLTLSWYGPTYDGGSIVKSYNLEIWNSLDNTWSDLTSCNSTSYHVQQLLPDRQYKFRVRAVNMYGIGEPSAESEPVTVGEPVVPGETANEPCFKCSVVIWITASYQENLVCAVKFLFFHRKKRRRSRGCSFRWWYVIQSVCQLFSIFTTNLSSLPLIHLSFPRNFLPMN